MGLMPIGSTVVGKSLQSRMVELYKARQSSRS